jgi:aminobenzoyl-glutamate transport protein
MCSIVSLIFLMFVIPGIVYGIAAKTIKSSKDVIDGMTKAMHSMAYYLVIMFFISQFVSRPATAAIPRAGVWA